MGSADGGTDILDSIDVSIGKKVITFRLLLFARFEREKQRENRAKERERERERVERN